MDKLDNYDKAMLKIEQAKSLNVALSALNQDGGLLNSDDSLALNSLACDLLEEAKEALSTIELK